MVRVITVLVTVLWAGLLASHAANTHGTPDMMREMRSFFADAFIGYVVSGCAPTVPASSDTLAAFACTGYVTGADGQLHYITQSSAGVGPLNAGPGTYWLALHQDRVSTVGGWTRQARTHYLWQLNASRPADPATGLVFAQVTVAGGVITAVEPIGPRTPSPWVDARRFGTDLAAIQTAINQAERGSTVVVRPGTWSGSTGLTITNKAIKLHCVGDGAMVNYTGTGTALSISGTATNMVEVQGCQFVGTSSATGGGILVSGANLIVRIHHNRFSGFSHATASDVTLTTVNDVRVIDNSFEGGRRAIFCGTDCQANTIEGNSFGSPAYTLEQVRIQGAANIILRNSFNGGSPTGLHVDGGHSGIVSHNWFEDQTAQAVLCDGGTGCVDYVFAWNLLDGNNVSAYGFVQSAGSRNLYEHNRLQNYVTGIANITGSDRSNQWVFNNGVPANATMLSTIIGRDNSGNHIISHMGTTIADTTGFVPPTAHTGDWTAVPFASMTYTADAGTWTVQSADQVTVTRFLVGRTHWIQILLENTSVTQGGGGPIELLMSGFLASPYLSAMRKLRTTCMLDDNGTKVAAWGEIREDEGTFRLQRQDSAQLANSANNTDVWCQFFVEGQ